MLVLVAVYQQWPPLLSSCLVLVHELHLYGPARRSCVDGLCTRVQLVCMEMKSQLNVVKCMNMVMETERKIMNYMSNLDNAHLSIIFKAVGPYIFCTIGKGICMNTSIVFKCIVFLLCTS